MKKAKQINLRLTLGQYARLQAEALKREMSLSEYVRVAAMNLPKLEQEIEEADEELNYYRNVKLSRTRWIEGE